MESVRIPNTVTTIGGLAFFCCDSLKDLDIPEGVTTIGAGAFAGCHSIEHVSIPSTAANIDQEDPFDECISVKEYRVAAGNPNYCSVDGVLFNKAMTKLLHYPCKSEVTDYAVPNGVVEIASKALWDSKNLVRLTIPSSVESMGSLTSCNNLEEISVDPNNMKFCTVDNVLFSKDKTKLIFYPVNKSGTSYQIPNSVKIIGGQAFAHCKNLTNISIPNSVTTIQVQAFYYCENLTSIDIPDSVTELGKYICENDTGLETASVGSGVTELNTTFYNCSSLKTVTLSDGLTQIISYTFHSTVLEDVYYKGSKSQWDTIIISYEGNDSLKSATIHYNS